MQLTYNIRTTLHRAPSHADVARLSRQFCMTVLHPGPPPTSTVRPPRLSPVNRFGAFAVQGLKLAVFGYANN